MADPRALDLADRLAAELAPRAAEADAAGTFPIESIDRARETGYTLLSLPVEPARSSR